VGLLFGCLCGQRSRKEAVHKDVADALGLLVVEEQSSAAGGQVATQARYEGVNRAFPPGYLSQPDSPAMGPVDPGFHDAGPGWGWLALLLPFVEQNSLYKSLNRNLPCWHPANADGLEGLYGQRSV
jgi:hypothetical protein